MLRRRLLYNKGGIDYSSAGVGDILCSDMSFVSATNFASSGKTAIGVIFRNASNKVHAIALANSPTPIDWGLPYEEVGAGVNITTLIDIASSDAVKVSTFDGKGNTDKITAQLGNRTDYAAGWCKYYFNTTGTAVGDWHLPSGAEWWAVQANRNTIIASLVACGGSAMVTYLWASEEYGAYFWDIGYGIPTDYYQFAWVYYNHPDYGNLLKEFQSFLPDTELTDTYIKARAAIQITY